MNSKPFLLSGLAIATNAFAEVCAGTPPNILFYIADDASYAHFGANGCKWVNTPAFDRVASEGVVFDNCYTPNAKSAPSRAVLLTGRYSWQLEAGGNHITNFPSNYKVFTEVLGEQGYAVGFTGKGWSPGNPGEVDGKPRRLTGEPYQKRKTQPPTSKISKIDYAANFRDFLDDRAADGKSWFFWAGSREPHRGYEYGSGAALGGRSIDEVDCIPRFFPDNEIVRNDMLDYGFEIEYFDRHLVAMLEELERRGELDNTVIIVTSDNGMPFPRAKANHYEQSHHQPLAIMWRNGIQHTGRRIADYVNFVDIAPTILDMAGIEPDGMHPMSGESIRPLLESDKSGRIDAKRDRIIFGRERDDYGRPANQGYPIRGIIRDSLLYIWNLKPDLYPACDPETGYAEIDGSPTKSVILDLHRSGESDFYYDLAMGKRPKEELYDLKSDTDCMHNLADDPKYAMRKRAMRRELLGVLRKQKDPRITGDGDIFDRYPYNEEQNWNFYEKVVSGEIERPWEITKWINPTDYDEYVRQQQAYNKKEGR